jgi:hypothetical protein
MQMHKVVRQVATVLATATLVVGGALTTAPAAIAEPSAWAPTHHTCGWTTCTAYWSVARTAEFNNEEKAKQLGVYGAGGLAAGGVAAIPGGQAAGLAIGAAMVEKAAEFDTQISSATNDHRCLIFKYPRNMQSVGWWGSVSAQTNENCKKANDMDKSVFAS